MSTFLLSPVPDGLPDPAWGLSWHKGPCEITAASVDEARQLAAGQFTVAVLSDPALVYQSSPWLDSRLVAVEPVAPGASSACEFAV